MTTRSITDAALLVRCTIRCWTGVRRDKVVTARAILSHNAETGAGKFDKHLLGPKDLRGVQAAMSAARAFIYENSLPWGEVDGERILPAANFEKFVAGVARLQSAYQDAYRSLVELYPSMIERSRERLGDMFREEDYPSADELLDQFDFDVSFRPMPDAADFRVELSAGHIEMIKEDIERRNKQDVEIAMRDLWERIHGSVSSLVTQLHRIDEGSIDVNGTRKSGWVDTRTLANISSLVDLLPRLNLTNDPDLEQARRILQDKIQGNSAADLKEDPAKRQDAMAAADEILRLMGIVPGEPAPLPLAA